jgi:hypothetical protein
MGASKLRWFRGHADTVHTERKPCQPLVRTHPVHKYARSWGGQPFALFETGSVGKFVVSSGGEAYDSRVKDPNRKFPAKPRILIPRRL